MKRAAPRNKVFGKMMQDGTLQKLVNDTEGYYLRDKKMHELDANLYFVVEERQNSVDLCEKGREMLSRNDRNLFVVHTLEELHAEIDNDESITDDAERMRRKELATNQFMDKSEKLHNINQLLKAFSLYENDQEYVVMDNKVIIVDQFTGRQMPGRRFQTDCTRPSKPKKTSPSKQALRPLPPSRCKTTSVCLSVSPA